LWSLLFRKYDEALIAALWEAGTAGLFEDDEGLRAYFEDTLDPSLLVELGGEFRAESEQAIAAGEDWEPIPAGERLLIVPASFRAAAATGRLLLRLEAGAAFGTGRHETTQLCLEAMERYLRASDMVLDVGCGSGILSAAAGLLGARAVFSCDIDEQAVAMARRQVCTPVFTGSADAVEAHAADLVLANLTAPILEQLAWDLKRVTRPGGILLVTGFMRERVPRGFVPEWEFEREGWLCWICRAEEMSVEAPREPLTHAAEWWLSS
jgi:ribosomal protein L11 methyltransferase